jgi:two-component system LytT family response regulator
MIKAILIDDDSNLRSGMKGLLALFAPQIEIIGEADTVATGVAIIEKVKPQLIFLDIQLTDGTGFDILEKITETHGKIESHVVFITAHEEFAIKAFRFSALDYLLKPVDPEELKKVIEKINKTILKNNEFSNVELLLENIKKQTNSFKRIALSNSDGIHLFEISDIIRCESEDNYTKFFIKNSKTILISKTLKEYEELLTGHGFERIHQSHLINLAYLKSYIKKDGGYVMMSDNSHLPISQRKKERLLNNLKGSNEF